MTGSASAPLAVDRGGNLFVASSSSQSFTFPPADAGLLPVAVRTEGPQDFWMAKLSPDGDALWARAFGTGGSQSAGAVAVDPCASEVFAAGSMAGSMQFATADGAVTLDYEIPDGSASSALNALFVARIAR